MKKMVIGKREIGPEFKPLIIAELGINHEGDLQVAYEMVDAAHQVGAEIMKHQTHVIEDEMTAEAKKVIPGNAEESIYDIMKRCALSEEEEIQLKNYIESKGMIFISTPFSRAAANRLEKMGVQAYKIGSGEMNNYPLLDHVASFGKPMIVSTGMNTIESVRKAVVVLEKRNVEYALLHTTNLYPTPPELVRLGAMVELQKEFPNAVIGLSDHTVNNFSSLAAIALGASIIERHFTDTKTCPGPDIINSMTPDELKELIQGSHEIFLMRGGKKEPTKQEQVTMDFAFATVVTIKNIRAGETFTRENLWVKRPGSGEILAEQFDTIIGKKSNRDLPADIHLSWSDIKNEE